MPYLLVPLPIPQDKELSNKIRVGKEKLLSTNCYFFINLGFGYKYYKLWKQATMINRNIINKNNKQDYDSRNHPEEESLSMQIMNCRRSEEEATMINRNIINKNNKQDYDSRKHPEEESLSLKLIINRRPKSEKL